MRDGVLFNLSLSLSLSLRFSKALEFRELFSPTQEEKKIISSNRIYGIALPTRNERPGGNLSLLRVRACVRLQKFFFFRGEIKIICSFFHTKQSTKKQNKKTKKIFLLQSRLWMGGTVAESGALLNFVFVVCSSSSLLHQVCATRG